ncbi:MAG: adenylosuccinate lyase [Candidatus Levybacteria bacterium RIFOXYA1_FULL_41_10]|nr:MAG: Adenylosuccinate lyase [Candidatus Levybacteria bacterium GW2011_GWA1_39_32]KKR51517.1 MAG: Adenylosuccinate lyase [Candidatus Levybacteria bacterium GW2011_GWC1_40_19]KKR95418.1 MAG: Adenylosuccinate lyase [Candidatus Levybacteria bacterium GW2011_GWA2_41_15]KKS01903.1 MAG: Adenylosuccinate lyase [Candidatus Levybacteria bacterium GW2011_GWB1_41_21]OGH20907.1 MAG: adenylosuccinate lyase [Candidatus Levybacteria bacterium RIFCSPHIGHO2_01_FULL_40_83]OGH25967.1 MAG: adenylosuccinate lyas
MSMLLAISPIDGRYKEKTTELSEFVSEYALIKARLGVEIKYLFALSKLGIVDLSSSEKSKLLKVLEEFDLKEAEKIKKIEDQTHHDVKAVEIYLRSVLSSKSSEMIHFGLTSEDINNLSYRIMLRSASDETIVPPLEDLTNKLLELAKSYKGVPMLARTHGQPAVPTTLGKEMAVFASRLRRERNKLKDFEFSGKLNGAVGNYNALYFAYPKINWIKFSQKLVESLDFRFNPLTTQVNPPEDIIEYFQTIQRINGILLDLNQDFWRYISDGWFVLESRTGQVGSSTMPQKINPIDFENSEGNLEIANGLIEVLERKLPLSRLQRDLSGSTIIRNLGVILAHSLISYNGTHDGLSKITPNLLKIKDDLNSDWSILTEALQTVLRKEGKKDAYLSIMKSVKGKKLSREDWLGLINELSVKESVKDELRKVTPETYLGLTKELL